MNDKEEVIQTGRQERLQLILDKLEQIEAKIDEVKAIAMNSVYYVRTPSPTNRWWDNRKTTAG